MQTHVEELPLEIWLIIFQYLEAHDIFGVFQNLNSHFNRILDSNQLSLYVRLKETDNNHLKNPNNPYWSNSALNRITCLRSVVQSRPTYFLEFLRWHADKLIRLQSLSINTQIRGISSIPYICQSLKELNRLEYLSLACGPYKIIFDTILALPTLRMCQLILKESPLSIDDLHLFHVNSPIKQLFIVFLNKSDYSLVNLLLSHTPKLKRLELSGSSFSFTPVSLFAESSFVLPELRVLKLKLESGYFTYDCFECLHTTLPSLKHFYFHYTKHMLPEIFFDHFNTRWWPIIEPIQCLDIHIKGHILIDDIDPIIQNTNLQKNRQILSDKINQSKEYLKFEWNQQDFLILKHIEITIIKD
jgi:hypothetical protein